MLQQRKIVSVLLPSSFRQHHAQHSDQYSLCTLVDYIYILLYIILFNMNRIHLSIVALVLLAGCLSCVRGTNSHSSDIVTAAADIEQWIIKIRRELHTYPELMFQVRNGKVVFGVCRLLLGGWDIRISYSMFNENWCSQTFLTDVL